MKTGCFKQIEEEKNNGFISISLYPSKNEFVRHEYKSLAPNWKLFENLKSNIISQEKFIEEFMEQLHSLNPNRVVDDLKSLVIGFEPILMTNGTKKKFCHRHVVADWLQNELNIQVEEYKVGKVSRHNGYMKKIENPTLF
ncbi:MAG: hypothetical protein CMD13_02945 [Flavobacteriales bacterium]|nr:hypothetical protein [Flavobacteriales bacterium]